MSILEALILGVVQGATEFLPISSSAHLILVPKFLRLSEQPLVFDTTLHIGTALALIIFFWKDLLEIVTALVKDIGVHTTKFSNYSKSSKLGLYILLAIIPADIAGILLKDSVESFFRGSSYVAMFLLLGTILMWIAQKFFNKDAGKSLTLKESLGIGLFQVLALFPGFSRSGSTISGGMILGMTKEEAARFSFLMSVPITLQAAIFQLLSHGFVIEGISPLAILIGLTASLCTGLICIKFLLDYLKTKTLDVFIVYRLILVFSILIFL